MYSFSLEKSGCKISTGILRIAEEDVPAHPGANSRILAPDLF
jgi:hypothetical protein